MRELKHRDRVLITEGPLKGKFGEFVKYLENGNCAVCLEGDTLSKSISSDYIEYVDPNYYYVTEMATVETSDDSPLRIQVNPSRNKIGNPYFKVLDTADFEPGKSRVCRLHFKDEGMEYHVGDGLLDWKLNSKDLKRIINLLNSIHSDHEEYTVWQMTCWLWNFEYGFFSKSKMEAYFNGEFDEKFKDNPSYVPSTQIMPQTWIYDPLKGKNKRSK